MTRIENLYPPAPANVPADITQLPNAYRIRVAAMIGGLFAFLLLYLVLISASVILAYVALIRTESGVFGFLLAMLAGLFCIFLVKGLFKRKSVSPDMLVSITEKDYPELFAFIRRVCEETGSPRPKFVYVSAEVTAAVLFRTSLLSLIVPPRKDLWIGLGLVNGVDLVEFKAILAHEFAHFAQRSTFLGRYLYVANQVMHEIIYGRDRLDRFVDSWASAGILVGLPAWGLKGAKWGVRAILSGMYRGLNLLHLSLSRQMEFDADNVAVSVTGSDAIIHSLARFEFANESLGDAAASLDAAADRGVFTGDLFYHQTKSAERIRGLRKNQRLDLPENATTQVQVFQPDDDGVSDKYRMHPTNHMREANAKRIYVRSPRDDRSPWLLFGDSAALKQEATRLFYRYALSRLETFEPRPAIEVQEFIDAEHSEMTFDPKYHGWYDDRYINPGSLRVRADDAWPADRISNWLRNWPAADLADWLIAHRKKQHDLNTLLRIKSGELRLKRDTFEMCDRQYGKRDVPMLIEYYERQLKLDAEDSDRVDREVFLAHWSVSMILDQSTSEMRRQEELLARYRFHIAIQGLLRGMFSEQSRLGSLLGYLSRQVEWHPDELAAIASSLEEIRLSIVNNLEDAKCFSTPALANVPMGSSLYEFIVDRGDQNLDPLLGITITGDWIMKLMARLDGVVFRIRRLHYKSLGSLLVCQEKLVSEWLASPVLPVIEPKSYQGRPTTSSAPSRTD